MTMRKNLRYRNNDTGSGAEPNEFSIPQPANPTNPQLPIIQCPTLGAIGASDPYISRCYIFEFATCLQAGSLGLVVYWGHTYTCHAL